jgi:hypothetical protein
LGYDERSFFIVTDRIIRTSGTGVIGDILRTSAASASCQFVIVIAGNV